MAKPARLQTLRQPRFWSRTASCDFKELKDVLFSLKCSLDHLGKVAEDILARANSQQFGPSLKDNLDVMITACRLTLQELETAIVMYRDGEINVEPETEMESAMVQNRTVYDVDKDIDMGWEIVQLDHEEQSLHQYRGCIKAHCDAINLVLMSIVG